MVTRTITSTKVNVLCLELAKAEPFNKVIELAGTYKDDKALMNAITNTMDTEKEKPVHIVDKEIVDKLYGMSEDEFIKSAQELDPKTRKPLEKQVEETVEV